MLSATVLRNRLLTRARLRHWQVLVRVAELGSVRRAAEAVGMTQPAVTHVLADLERLLGCPLFDRHARGMHVNAAGRALLVPARALLGQVDDAAERVAALSARAQGVVRVAAISGAVSGLLAQALPRFGRAHPDVLVQLEEADAIAQGRLVSGGEVDLALCRAPQVLPDGWAFTPLCPDRFAIVCAPGHPLLRRRRVTPAELRRATWLASPPPTAARVAFDHLFGEDPPPLRQVSTRATGILWAMLRAEPLLCVVPHTVVRQLLDAGELAELHTEAALPFDPLGMLQPLAGQGEAALRLAGFLRDYAASITPDAASPPAASRPAAARRATARAAR